MIGAIAGDVIGSIYEGTGLKIKDFPLFGPGCRFTDDTVLTVAVAEWIMHGGDLVDRLHEYVHRYPRAGYGGAFIEWAARRDRRPYGSWGNGSAMRVGAVGFAFDTLDDVLAQAKQTAEVTHDHREGIRGAQAVAAAVFLARTGRDKPEIRTAVEDTFRYDLSTPLDEIRETYAFEISCQGSVPQSIVAFLEARDFEDAVRNAISLGGDADTMACIAGAIADAYWGVPEDIERETFARLDEPLAAIVREFQSRFPRRRSANRPSNETRSSDDRRRGCLLGLAVGDALGAAVEFLPPGRFEPVTGFRAGGPHGLGPGEWTDDASMALALADSIAQAGWDLDDQARRYVSWWREGAYSVNGRCFDIGNTVRDALSRFEQGGDARASADSSSRASGNGSIMRLAPVPIRFANLFPHDIEQLARLAAESSLPTHASLQCLSACRYFAVVLAGLLHGLDRRSVLSADWEPLRRLQADEPLHPEVAAVAAGSFRELNPPAIKGNGYVVKSLEAALWAFHDAVDFREAVLRAVNLGDDADTTGAVCGQLAGAHWGVTGIPQEWLAGLAKREMIETALAGLMNSMGPATEKTNP